MTGSNSPRLRDEYAGVLEAIPDVVLTLDGPRTLHLPAREGDRPACQDRRGRDWRSARTEDALVFGGELCRGCFELPLEFLSRDPSSPVERVDTDAEADPNPEIVVRAEADGGEPARLTSPTEVVARTTGGALYHAPTAGGALCGVDADVVVERELVDSHYGPCTECFDLDEEE